MQGVRDEVTDPVCGMVVSTGSPLRYVLGHEEYVFCSSECRERFADDAAKYIGRDMFNTHAYTCPRDMDVSTYSPGWCPKCHRALEPVRPGKRPPA
jgi:P-type Cu+ transporter